MRTIIFSLVLIIISCNKVFPQTDPESGISDPASLESFLDGMMNDHLKSKDMASAVVAIVKDENIHLNKVYGYSGYENKGPVSPDSTLSRIGSIPKTFTLNAVMQLAAQVYQWRGPNRNGIIPETGLLKAWPDKGPELLWSFKGLGEGHTSVGPAKGRLFITGLEGNRGYLFAFDYNGNLIWKVPYGPEWTENYIGPRSTPVVIDDRVYLQSGFGVVYCINAGTGKTEWSVDLLKEYGGKKVTWGLVENLLIVGDKIICTPGGLKNNVVALNRLTGKLIWSSPGNGRASAYCSSIYVKHNETELIITTTDGSVIGIDANTGQAYWHSPQNQGNHIHANTPLYSNGIIYCATEEADSDNGLVALQLSDDGKKVTQLWRNREFMNLMEGFILRDGLIYGSVYEAGKWLCIDAKNGSVLHSFSGLGDGIILWADGLFYCYTKKGEVALVSADRNAFKIISRFRVPMGDGPHFSHPVIHKGKMYIRHGSVLMVYRIS